MSVKIFVVHNPKNLLRRKVINLLLADFDVSFCSAEDGGEKFVALHKPFDQDRIQAKLALWPAQVASKMSSGEVLATASHLQAWSKARGSWTLIVEDDAIPAFPNLPRLLLEAIFNLPRNADLLYLGGGFPLNHVCPIQDVQGNFVKVGDPSSNTCVAYLARTDLLKDFLAGRNLFDLPIDYEIAIESRIAAANVWHLNEYLFLEGSKFVYDSNLR